MPTTRTLLTAILVTTSLLISPAASADSQWFWSKSNDLTSDNCVVDLSIQPATFSGPPIPAGSKVTSVAFSPVDNSTCDTGTCRPGDFEVDSIFVSHGGTTVLINGTTHVFDGLDASGTWSTGGVGPNGALADFDALCGGPGNLQWIFIVYYTPPAPKVTLVTPSSGSAAGGTAVTFKGNNLTPDTVINFFSSGCPYGGLATNLKFVDSQTMTGVTPPGCPSKAELEAQNANGTQSPPTWIYSYVAMQPTIAFVAPARGPLAGGTTVTIGGTNLSPSSTVTFGGAPATHVTWVNPNTLRAVTPPHAAGAVDVTVSAWGLSGTRAAAFVYPLPPALVQNVLDRFFR
jgi:hypothetical protein